MIPMIITLILMVVAVYVLIEGFANADHKDIEEGLWKTRKLSIAFLTALGLAVAFVMLF